jgi:putative SOS response-associated peptidase YedK
MCNMYSMVSNKEAIRAFANFLRVTPEMDNLPAIPGIYANGWAPIVRATDDGTRELSRVRWGLPTPADKRTGNADRGVTNLRNLFVWKDYLEPFNRRCVVPATSFCEPDQVGGSNKLHWYALDDSRPLFFFAGAWIPKHKSVRLVKDGETEDDLFAFLTTKANAEVGAVHNKAMPVILRTPEEVERWFTIPYPQIAKGMQLPLPDGSLKVVNIGPRQDGGSEPVKTAPDPAPAPPQGELF